MSQELKKEKLSIEGMTCSGCENRIENTLKKIEGVESVKASTADSGAEIVYDPAKTGPAKFREAVEKLGYKITGEKKEGKKSSIFGIAQLLGIGVILFALYFVVQNTVGFSFIPQITQNMGFGILFVVGLITSIHCIAMCGGINLSQCVREDLKASSSKTAGIAPSLLYNTGRVLSYTVIGGIVGAVGSAFSFSPMAKGAIAIIAGVFMLIMGLNMLKAFSFLSKLNIRMPKFISSRVDKINSRSSNYGPFVVGLLNGLMPCGPLQAMQVYALGTGSAVNGALSMFFFSLGTVPLMFGLGAAGTLLSRKFTNMMFRVGGMLVLVLGLFMVNNGLSLSGKSIIPVSTGSPKNNAPAIVMEDGKQVIRTEVLPNYFEPITVRKGIPVKWILHVKPENLNGCNNAVIVPQYGIQKPLTPGDNIIEFTPNETGTVPYSCWMGMIRSKIEVIDDNAAPAAVSNTNVSYNGAGGNSCCSGGSNPRYAGGKIPTDNIGVAKIINGVQEVTVDVGDNGYDPSVLVLQKNVPAKIHFNPVKLSSCNYQVVFPAYRGTLDLSKGQLDTPPINIVGDFGFQCGMGMLHGLVKTVNNLKTLDIEKIKNEVAAYRSPVNSPGGSCCAGGQRPVN